MKKLILLLELALLLVWCSLPGADAGFWKPKSTNGASSVGLGGDVDSSSGSSGISSSSSSSVARVKVGSNSKHRTAASNIFGDGDSTGESTTDTKNSVLSLPVLHNLKYTVPYSFEECVEDLRQILTTLLTDVGSFGTTSKEKHAKAEAKADAKARAKAKAGGRFDYRLSDFASQAIELCSPESHDTLFDNLQSEIGSGRYPQTCVVLVNSAQGKQAVAADPETDCFELLIRIEQQLKNKHLLKEKLLSTTEDRLKAVPKQARLQSNRSPSLVQVGEARKANQMGNRVEKSRTLLTSSGRLIKEADSEMDVGFATITLLKTLFRVTNKPTTIHSTVTKTEVSKSLGTVTTTKTQTSVSTSTTLVKSVASVTDLLVEVTVTTETVGKKTLMQWETFTTTKTVNRPYMLTDLPILKQDVPLVEAEYIPGRRTLTMETTMTTLMTTTSRLMLVSRICHAVTRFGITCPTIPASSSSKTSSSSSKSEVSKTTTTTTTTDITTSTSCTITTKTKTTAKTTTKTMTATRWEEKEPCDDDEHPDYPHHHPVPPKNEDDCDDDDFDDDDDCDDDDYYYFQDSHDFVEKYAVELALPMANTKPKRPRITSEYNNTKIVAASLDPDYDDLGQNNSHFRQFKNYSGSYKSVENKSAHFLSSLFLNALFALLILVIIV